MIAGYAVRDITPPDGLEMCGYGYYLGRVAKGIHDRLYARGLYIENETGSFLLISCDLEGMSVATTDLAKNLIQSSLGLPPLSVMIHCTHTHSGPATARCRGCGKMDDDYVSTIPGILCELAKQTIESAADVKCIRSGNSQTSDLAFNRVYADDGPIDNTVRVLVLDMAADSPIILVNYACHPVCSGVNYDISADYPGWVVKTLAENGYRAIYVTGFCGDIDPLGERGYERSELTGKAVAQAALDAVNNSEKLESAAINSGIIVSKAWRIDIDVEELMDVLRTARDTLEENPRDGHALCYLSWAIDTLDAGECTDIEAPIMAITIGNTALVGIPGEVFTAFGLSLRKEFPQFNLMTVNEANGVIGYIPTCDEFDRDGYSVVDSCRIYAEFMFARGFGEKLCYSASILMKSMTEN